ncbi:F-box/FBD/LRR-repeat protein At1g13570-like [Chenopodium quinoa]|uniref:F-box/FBD/LRR-repeat protein At1g13570-like n=1 Tax=Chenopodium quinoa TaxID=63459 RepID=UPI000B788637|nr:F-box/FBD/LRR-repeat protein At1g13570-like [Chenopodium quinoa]
MWETYNTIINNSFLHHHGPIHEFYLYIPDNGQNNGSYQKTLNLNAWLHFLSHNGVKKITLINYLCLFAAIPLPSHIYSCIELEELTLSKGFILKRPSTEFKCIKHIRKLELNSITLDGDIFSNLIANCPKLIILKLEHCLYHKNIVIDAPKLENLTLNVSSSIGLLSFKNIPNLAKLELSWCDSSITDRQTAEAADAIKKLAASCDLKSLFLRDYKSNKIFAAIGKKKVFPLALAHLYELSLGVLNLNDFGVFSCTFGFIQSCPSFKKLAISVSRPNINVEVEHDYDYDNNYKLGNLVEVDIDGVTASKAELKLIEYVLSASIVLQRFTIKFGAIGDVAELKVQRKLNGFQRASPKTQIVF